MWWCLDLALSYSLSLSHSLSLSPSLPVSLACNVEKLLIIRPERALGISQKLCRIFHVLFPRVSSCHRAEHVTRLKEAEGMIPIDTEYIHISTTYILQEKLVITFTTPLKSNLIESSMFPFNNRTLFPFRDTFPSQ